MNSGLLATLFAGIAALTQQMAGHGPAQAASAFQQAANACPEVRQPACEGALTPTYDARQCLTGYSCAPAASASGASCKYNGRTYRIGGHGRDAGSAVSTAAALRRVANYEGYMLRRPVGLALWQGPLTARVFAAGSPPPIGRPPRHRDGARSGTVEALGDLNWAAGFLAAHKHKWSQREYPAAP